MTNLNQLIEQQVRQRESHLKHIDELLGRAREGARDRNRQTDVDTELVELAQQRDTLAGKLKRLRLTSLNRWQEQEIEKAGPMAVWDAVAQQLERLVERLER